jgi:hypothetical protein
MFSKSAILLVTLPNSINAYLLFQGLPVLGFVAVAVGLPLIESLIPAAT